MEDRFGYIRTILERWKPEWNRYLILAGVIAGLLLAANILLYVVRRKNTWKNREYGSCRRTEWSH